MQPFVSGKHYNRTKDIHDRFGGQRQSGIITPSKHPIIIVVTSPSGSKYGYNDTWNADGTFTYYGEGQTRDMTFVRGNRALRDHVRDKKKVYLFESDGAQSNLRCVGQFRVLRIRETDEADSENRIRKAISFVLERVEGFS